MRSGWVLDVRQQESKSMWPSRILSKLLKESLEFNNSVLIDYLSGPALTYKKKKIYIYFFITKEIFILFFINKKCLK